MWYRWVEWGSEMSYVIAHLSGQRFLFDQFEFLPFVWS